MGRNPSISAEQVLQVLRDRDRGTEPVLSTTEVADRTGVSSPTAKKRLDLLVDEGALRSQTYGRVPVYWPADERITQDPEPITGEVADEVAQYADRKGQRRSAAIRSLVELGLEAESADVRPGEMRAKREALKDEVARKEEAVERWQEYAVAGGVVSAGIVLAIVGTGLPTSPLAPLPFVVPAAEAILAIAGITTIIGLIFWVWVFAKPTLRQLRE